jgi:hypothetical protein
LSEALENERAQLSDTTTAPDPELVAVFDLAGSVEAFMRAVAKIDGLEFLAELQEDYVDPDDDFYYTTDGETSDDGVPQSLYMAMASAQAVTELVRLFELWQENQSIKFARGLNPLKQVFALLRTIRRWGPEDRVRETGLLEQWREDIAVAGAQGMARVEIELWYRAQRDVRAVAQSEVSSIVQASGGHVVATSDVPVISYHAILADVPFTEVEQVLIGGPHAIELLTTERVMLVAPSIPMALPATESSPDQHLQFDETLPSGLPRVALLDGVPLANHRTLAGRLVVDDPDDRTADYEASQMSHGTGMASLIAHGDLSDPGAALRTPIYLRPVLQPHVVFTTTEITPPSELLVDVIHRAFHRMFEGDGVHDPAAPSVRVVNLSIGEPARVFVRRLSPLARLLDWLAHQYNLVVIVSAGNHDEALPIVDTHELEDEDQMRSSAARSLHEQARHRRLLSPAEAINVVSVGALHADGVTVEIPDTVLDVVPEGMPASYSPVGFGFRRSVKPEIMLPGGRALFSRPPPDTSDATAIERATTAGAGPGLCVAAPGLAGQLDSATYICGTSCSAALATRTVNNIFEVLAGLEIADDGFPFPDAQYHPVVAKTLLVHAAGWNELRGRMQDLLGLPGQTSRRELTRLMGYGPVRQDRVATADRVRAVLLGAASIGKNQRHTFRLPLPPALAATTEWRRLTITLGWLSPINTQSQKYRMARLWFTPPRDELAVAPIEADHDSVRKGTVQHQVLEGDAAVAFTEGSALAIDIDCRSDAGTLPGPVRYAIAASLEVSAAVQVDLHDQVRSALRTAIREQVPARPQ